MSDLDKDGYLALRNVIDLQTLGLAARYYDKKFNVIKDSHLAEGARHHDPVEPYSLSYYNDILTYGFMEMMKPTVEEVSGKELLYTFCTTRLYRKGQWLRKHKDHDGCEYSITLPVYGDGTWPIYINGNEIILELGDIAIYKGNSILHWRKKLTGPDQLQLHFHYVDKHGPYAWAENDERVKPKGWKNESQNNGS